MPFVRINSDAGTLDLLIQVSIGELSVVLHLLDGKEDFAPVWTVRDIRTSIVKKPTNDIDHLRDILSRPGLLRRTQTSERINILMKLLFGLLRYFSNCII